MKVNLITNQIKNIFSKPSALAPTIFLGIGSAKTCLDYFEAPEKVVMVLKDKEKDREKARELPLKISLDVVVRILENSTEEYPLKNNRITFYVCKGQVCLPPVNEIEDAYKM